MGYQPQLAGQPLGIVGGAGEDFFAAITAPLVPVDTRALRALKRSLLAVNLYAWLTHTAFVATRNRTNRVVSWSGLHGQVSAEYAQCDDSAQRCCRRFGKSRSLIRL